MSAILPTRRRGRLKARLTIIVVLLILIVGGGGTVLWNAAAARAGATLDAWFAREAARGHEWSCPQRRFTGYPLRIAIDCVEPVFAVTAGKDEIKGSAKGFQAEFALYQPDRVTATLEGPVEIDGFEGRKITLNWDSARVVASGLPFGIDRVAFEVEKPSAELKSDTQDQTFGAARASLVGQRLLPPSAQDPDFGLTLHLDAAALPPLDHIMGTGDPATIDLEASVYQIGLLDKGSFGQRLEAWRVAGGKIDIVRATLLKGPANVSASGKLSLDDGHRPQGNVNLSLAGVEGVLRRFGIPVQASTIGGFLGGLFSSKKPQPGEAQAEAVPARALKLALGIADGHVSIGVLPLPIGGLRPLY